MRQNRKYFYLALLCFTILDVLIWRTILFPIKRANLELYFLNIGQGDSELILTDGVKVMIDGGQPNGRALSELAKILPATDRYIDLVEMTHPQLDHYGGLIDVLKNYQVGAFISSGLQGDYGAYSELEKVLKEKNIRRIYLGAGDQIKYQNAVFYVLNPSQATIKAKDLNDTSVVMLLKKDGVSALYTGDMNGGLEAELAKKYNIKADVLKVSHHGSRFSSDLSFLKKVSPAIAVIEVGKNTYGHPTPQTLARLADVGAIIGRTDQEGTIKIIYDGQRLKVYRE